MEYTGKGIGVCILDTGIYPHIDFDNRIKVFVDFIRNRKKPYDENGHGTHVAGILGGSGKGCQGKHKGCAPGCNFVILKVLDQYGNGKKEVLLQAFAWLKNNWKHYGIRIVNISVGTTCHNPREHRLLIGGVEELWDLGLIVVAAAGNQGPASGSITAPGSSRKIITVGSSDMNFNVWDASGRGPTGECICKPDIVAPGYRIISCAPSYHKIPAYTEKSGTSMSTPYVSGTIARLLEKDPRLTNVEVKMLLMERAVDLGYPHNIQGWGLLDPESFLRE
jgi:serine protease AprX